MRSTHVNDRRVRRINNMFDIIIYFKIDVSGEEG